MNGWMLAGKRQAPGGKQIIGSRGPGSRSVPPSRPVPLVPQPTVELNVTEGSTFNEKATGIIGNSKRSSKSSREESEAVLSESSHTAAGKIVAALTTGQPGLKAFEKVAFTMAGQTSADLITKYGAATGGRSLSADITTAFAKTPGKRAAAYLLDCLANNGMPSLRARMWVVLGDVDSSGSVARALASAPVVGDKIGNAGDTRRMCELFEAATPSDRVAAWLDPDINQRLLKLDKKVHKRIQMLMDVENAEEQVDKATTGGGAAAVEKQKLAEARDRQLSAMVRSYISTIPGTGKLVELASGVNGIAQSKLGAKPIGEQSWQNLGFKAKDFYDDLVDWKSTATTEDIAQIQKPTSSFNIALALVPKNAVTGLSKSERAFITNLSGSVDMGGTKTQTKAVTESLERQKNYVERGEGTGSWLVSKIKLKVGGGKWRDLATEIKLLSADQRKAMLDEYSTDPKTAIPLLEADLKAAGFDKEARAETVARFNTDFGSIGDNYAELWQIVNPGKGTKVATFAAHLAPAKWSKIGDAVSGDARGTKAKKVMFELEDNEFALVRQDRALLAAIRACSNDKTWATILDLLGMGGIDDQLQNTSSRETVHEAQLAGEANPKRFAILLDDAIAEDTVGKGVSAGRDKAQLYNIADKAMNAAKLKSRDDKSAPVDFMKSCLDELAKMERGADRIAYLQKRVPQVYAAFKEATPIPAADRMTRAKHEGFGVGSLRVVDRQKLQWSFNDLSGKQLLDQWSNVDEFIAMNTASRDVEGKISKAALILSQAPDNPNPKQQAEQAKASEDIATYTSLAGEIYGKMNTFTVGIKRSRRDEFKKVGVGAEDRIKFEAMVSDKLADAMDDDPEVQAIFDDIKLPYDDFMRAKMKGIDALEMQRYLDSTRQWHAFSTKTSELSEATRNVKGGALGTEQRLHSARSQGKSGDEISEIRKEGAETTEGALADRNMIEARFRDMQATFRERAKVLFKLIVTAIITGVVAAATWGAGTPLAIGIHLALEMGFNALQAAYQYYVLGERDLRRIAVDFAFGVLESTVRVLTANLAMGLNASLLHPSMMPPGLEWVSQPLAKGMSKVVHGAVMFAPKHIIEQAFHDKDLEKVVKEGEASMADEAVSMLGKQAKGFMTKMLVGGVKQGLIPIQDSVTGTTTPAKTAPPQKNFNQAMNDRMAGGGDEQEQQDMWAKYQKEKQKAAKQGVKQMVLKGATTENEKAAEKDQHKDHMKDMRDKEDKSAQYKLVSATILNDSTKLVFRKARGERFLTLLAAAGISVLQVRGLGDKEKGKIETELHMTPGQIDRELRLSPDAESGLRALAAFNGAYDANTVPSLAASGAISTIALMRIPPYELAHIAIAAGVTADRLVADLKKEGLARVQQARSARAAQIAKTLPPTPPPKDQPTKSSSTPPRRVPPKDPTKVGT